MTVERNVLLLRCLVPMTIETIQVVHETWSKPLDFAQGSSTSMEALNTALACLAQTDIPVLIVGESGTGKDVYAQRLHQLSVRAGDSFEKIQCASTDSSQI